MYRVEEKKKVKKYRIGKNEYRRNGKYKIIIQTKCVYSNTGLQGRKAWAMVGVQKRQSGRTINSSNNEVCLVSDTTRFETFLLTRRVWEN